LIQVINDQVAVRPTILGIEGRTTRKSTIWGPTCDGLDAVCENIQLPELDIGDWIFWENMGAYSLTIACNFNNFPQAKVYPYVSHKKWSTLKKSIQLGEQQVQAPQL
jgi:ornithine decarboxylase